MPLILAIEPDRRQAAHLTSVVRRSVAAELILVDTTERALDAIGNQVPDLVLVPALLSPHDDAALATALRVIAAAAHVQMLTIPVLGARRPTEKPAGVLQGLRRDRSRAAEPEGCDPTVFAEQIASYLERAAQERANLLADALPDDPALPEDIALPEDTAPPEDIALPEEAAAVDVRAVEPVADALPLVAAPAEEAASIEPPLPDPVDEHMWTAVEDAVRSQFLTMTPEPAPLADWAPPIDEEVSAVDEEPHAGVIETGALETGDVDIPVTAAIETPVEPPQPDGIDERVWMAVEEAFLAQFSSVTPEAEPLTVDIDLTVEIESLTEADEESGRTVLALEPEDTDVVAFTVEPVAAVAPPEPVPPAKGDREWVELIASLRHDIERLRTERSKPAPKPSAPRPVRSTRTGKASENEWGLFDPEQCGFAALLAKLDEVTESDETLRA